MSKALCVKGAQQSPINIISKISKKCGATCDLTFFYRTSKLNIILSNKNIIIDYDTGSYINFNQEIYELDKISFTNPSSHKIDGISYPVEAHLYHRSPNTGKILIIAIFIDINDAISRSKIFFDSISPSIPNKRGEQISANMSENWTIYNIIPEVKGFFLYTGSIPRYPCSEGVTWIIFDEPVNCSEEFYNSIKKVSRNNARALKKLGPRTIYYNPNTSEKNSRNYGTQLRCYTDKEFQQECAKLSKNSELGKNKNVKVLIITINVILIVVFVLFILWVIDKGFLSKFIVAFNEVLNKKVINQ